MKAYEQRYPQADVVLLEPGRDDYRMFFTNVFSFTARRKVAAHAYDATRRDLRERADAVAPLLARHGLRLRREVLEDPTRDLWEGVGVPADERESETARTLRRVDRALDRAERLLDR
jgi:hypothetical protein